MKNIDKYQQDQLSDDEQDALFGPLIRAKFREDQRAEWATRLASEYQVHRGRTATSRRLSRRIKRWLVPIAAAAAVLLLLILLPFGNGTDFEELTAMTDRLLYEEPFPNLIARKGAAESTDLIRQQAAEAYTKADYPAAIRYGESLRATGAADVWDRFYLSLSYLYTKQYEMAISELEQTRRMSEAARGEFLEEIRWYTALAYLQTGQGERAGEYLRAIPVGSWKYEEALILLQRLDAQ